MMELGPRIAHPLKLMAVLFSVILRSIQVLIFKNWDSLENQFSEFGAMNLSLWTETD